MTNPSVRDLVDRALLPLRAVDGALYDRVVWFPHRSTCAEMTGE